VPTFCRHNRLVQNCPTCSRAAKRAQADEWERERESRPKPAPAARSTKRSPRAGALKVRQMARAADDGYRAGIVPGLKATADAEHLAGQMLIADARLRVLASDPPGLYQDVALARSPDEAIWLAFLIAYLGPTDDEDPFAGIAQARTSWESAEVPSLEGVPVGARGSHRAGDGNRTLIAYRAWAERHGGQVAALAGESSWTPERRFDRVFERLAIPGLARGAKFDFLVTLGALGVLPLRADRLHLVGDDPTVLAAKRVFGIGDTMLLERRAADLATVSGIPIGALDRALWAWGSPSRARDGAPEDLAQVESSARDRVLSALDL
jgi:hypothetical protein